MPIPYDKHKQGVVAENMRQLMISVGLQDKYASVEDWIETVIERPPPKRHPRRGRYKQASNS